MRRAGAEITASGQPASIWRQGHGVDLTFVSRPGLSADAAHDGARLPIPYPDHLVFADQNEVPPVGCEGEALDETHMPAGIELQDRCVAGDRQLLPLIQHHGHAQLAPLRQNAQAYLGARAFSLEARVEVGGVVDFGTVQRQDDVAKRDPRLVRW